MFEKRIMQRELSRDKNRKARVNRSVSDSKAAQNFPDSQIPERIMYICKVL